MKSVPRSMRYIAVAAPGDADGLRVAETDTPVPGRGQVLIRVRAAGVNRLDIMQRRGKYPPPPGASEILGVEAAGVVAACGVGARSVRVGDAVCALLTGGGYAEYVVADAAVCLPLPRGLSFAEGAAIPETFYTVWSNVMGRAGLRAGESLLVHGGGSGIGTTAIQLGKELGATVFATAGSKEKCRACLELGAARAVNYQEEDFVDAIKEATGGAGVNVILDMALGDYLQKNIQSAATEGRIVVIAGLRGYATEVNLLPLMQKRLTLTGSTLRSRELSFKAAIARQLRRQVWPWLESGRVKPIIHQEFPLLEAAAAHRLMESGGHVGKIVLVVG